MTKPYPYQREDAKRIHQMGGRVLLAHQMGLGKSLVSLLYAHSHPKIRPILVICPASLKWNWEAEASLHFGMRAEILSSLTPPKRWLARPNLVVANYDIIAETRRGPGWAKWLQENLQPQLIILDECHFLGDPSTKRTKTVRWLCKHTPFVLALSGTPLISRPAELWPTLNILRPELWPSFMAFGHRYCGARRTPWGWDFRGATHLPELHRLLEKHVMIRRRKEDVLQQLPSKQRSVVPLALKDLKEYDNAHKDFLAWLSKQSPGRARKAARAERLVKVGYLKRLAAVMKLPAVFDWVDNFLQEDGGKLILFAIHQVIIKALHERYRKISVVVDGSVTGKARQKAVETFQKSEGCRLFIGNIKAAGTGWTGTAASAVAFAEYAWTPGDMVQCEDRAHRIGQKKSVTTYWLTARGTIEEKLVEILQRKQKDFTRTIDGLGKGDALSVFDQLYAILLQENRK